VGNIGSRLCPFILAVKRHSHDLWTASVVVNVNP
jgi:hypothetical protein